MKHHDDAIARYVARVSVDPEVRAIVVAGSLARGTERADSDVDLYLVVTEERWQRGLAENRVIYVEEDAGYEGGYYDVKLATESYLEAAAERADDPMRDSFAFSRVVYSEVDGLDELIARVATKPADQWLPLAESFLAQARLHGGYFLPSAHEHHDPILLHHAAVHTAVSASRSLLALAHVTFQGPKYLGAAIAQLDSKPTGWSELITELLEHPTPDAAGAVISALESFRDWGISDDDSLSTFVVDNELAWFTGRATPEYS